MPAEGRVASGIALAGLVALGSVAAAEGSGDAAPAAWSILSPSGGGFSIEMPGEPTRESDARFTPGGNVRETKYWLAVEGAELAVETHDLPALATFVMSDAALLDQARDGVIGNDGGEALTSEEVVVQGAPARAFTWRYPGEPVRLERSLTVLVGSRLYLLTGTGADPLAHPAVERFFASFRLEAAKEGD